MTNEDVLQNLLSAQSAEPLKVPTDALRDWINTIPSRLAYRSARMAYLKRVPAAGGFFEEHPHKTRSNAEHRTWLAAVFLPPVYVICDQTGERSLMSPEFLEHYGLLDNTPKKTYRMPQGLDTQGMRDWLSAKPDEKDVFYMDGDGNHYDLVDGQFIPKTGLTHDQ